MNISKLSIVISVIFITSIIGLALSYFTVLIDVLPDLNFLEAIGVYALYMPIHNLISSRSNSDL